MKELTPMDGFGNPYSALDDDARRRLGAPWGAEGWQEAFDERLMGSGEDGQGDPMERGNGGAPGRREVETSSLSREGGPAMSGADRMRSQAIAPQGGVRRFVDVNLLKSLKKITKQARSLDPEVEARILQLVRAGTRAVGVVLRDHIDGLGEVIVRVTQTPHGVSVLLKGPIAGMVDLVRSTLVDHGVRVVEVRAADEERRHRSLKQEREGVDALV